MASTSHTTTDHDAIRRWTEERGGHPAAVSATHDGGEVGILRIEFADDDNEGLERVSWEEFFQKFEEKKLAFLYQEEIDGNKSRFFKFVARE